MRTLLLTLSLCFFSYHLFAQQNTAITFFSKQGEKFFLYLNKEKQNKKATNRVTVKSVKNAEPKEAIVAFEDATLGKVEVTIYLTKNEVNQFIVQPSTRKGRSLQYEIKKWLPKEKKAVELRDNKPTTKPSINTNTSSTDAASSEVKSLTELANVEPKKAMLTEAAVAIKNSEDEIRLVEEKQKELEQGITCEKAISDDDFKEKFNNLFGKGLDVEPLGYAKKLFAKDCLNSEQIIQCIDKVEQDDMKFELLKFLFTRSTNKKEYAALSDRLSNDKLKDEFIQYAKEQLK